MAEATSTEEKKPDDVKPAEDWMQKKWRPMMGWQYMFVCVFDFVVFPIMFTIVQFWETQAANDAFRQWIPLTLSNGGLYHLAMGAVLGISAWSRGQEKMAGMNAQQSTATPAPSGGINIPSQPMYQQPQFNSGINPSGQVYTQQRYMEPEPLGKGGMPLVKPGAYD